MVADNSEPIVPPVYIGIPCVDRIELELTRWLVWLAQQIPTAIIDIHQGNNGVADNRNALVRRFLQTPAPRLWMIDADVVPPRRLDILDTDAPFAAGPYRHHLLSEDANEITWSIWRDLGHSWAPLPLEAHTMADAASAGCWLLDRTLLEHPLCPAFEPPSEDLTFCRHLAAATGIRPTILPDYRCHHIQTRSLTVLEAAFAG